MPHQPSKNRLLPTMLCLCIIVLILSACQTILTPRVVLWHSWEGEQGDIFNSAIERFSEIFDEAVIVTSYVPADEMVDRYSSTASQGLGPDIFVAPSTALRELVEAGLIAPLESDALNPSLYYATALASLTYDEHQYGVPLAMRPLAMYYNRDLVQTPATTLSELLAQAEAGIGVAINTQFSQIIWGVQAFGGQIVDQDGRIILNQGAFTNWLNWLMNANSHPQVYLSRDATTLRRLFIDGRVAYYTGTASELSLIRSEMGEDVVGVVPLPSGPNGASGPLMQVEVLMFNPASSPVARDTALRLASFLTNLEQANTFMRDLELVPTNMRVRVDSRTYPAIAGFIAQTRTAIALPELPQVVSVLDQGDDVLLRVFEGVITPNTAAQELSANINSEFGLTTLENTTLCNLAGEVVLWHSLTNNAEVYLQQYVNSLRFRCPGFTMLLEYVPVDTLMGAYLEAFSENSAPDMILTSTSQLQMLVEAGAVVSIEREMMQSYSPISQATVSLGGIAYGIPVTLSSNVFYYNANLVPDAPSTTDELLVEGSPPFALSRNADSMLWTLTAYNGIAMNADMIVPDLDQLTAWLEWLSQVDRAEHITITANTFLRKNRFKEGESAYYIGTNFELAEVSTALGDSLGISLFPTGTSRSASPLVTSLALFVNPNSENINSALGFTTLFTATQEQESMVQTLRWIPANTAAVESLSADLLLATIAETIQVGIVLNDEPRAVLTEVSRAIDQIFTGGQEAGIVAQELFESLLEVENGE